jgi:hypothetical protein
MRRVGKDVGKFAVKLYRRSTTGWRRNVQFEYTVRVLGNILTVNAGTRDRIYKMLDETGARPHKIFPRGPYPLRFQWAGPGSYIPKTTPRSLAVNLSGGARGPMVRLMYVNHPGFEPREFTEVIRDRVEPKFIEKMEADVRLWAAQYWS